MQTIAAGGDHAAAITKRGFLYQWGLECADEQLTRFNATPVRVGQIDSITVTSVSCGTHHSVLIGNGKWYSGIAYAWGRGSPMAALAWVTVERYILLAVSTSFTMPSARLSRKCRLVGNTLDF